MTLNDDKGNSYFNNDNDNFFPTCLFTGAEDANTKYRRRETTTENKQTYKGFPPHFGSFFPFKKEKIKS